MSTPGHPGIYGLILFGNLPLAGSVEQGVWRKVFHRRAPPETVAVVAAVVALFPEFAAFVPHGETGHTGANVQNWALTVFLNPSMNP